MHTSWSLRMLDTEWWRSLVVIFALRRTGSASVGGHTESERSRRLSAASADATHN